MSWYPGKFTRGTPVIPYGPGTPYETEAAVVAAFPVGTVVYDMAETVDANKYKRIRYVVDLNGPDTLMYPVFAQDIRFVPWEIEWVCNDLASTQVSNSRLMQFLTPYGTALTLYKTTQTNARLNIRNSAGTNLFSLDAACPSNGFFKCRIVKNGNTSGVFRLYINNVLISTSSEIDYSNWTGANQVNEISMSDSNTDLRPYRVLNYRAVLSGYLTDCLIMDESSGTSLANQCDPARPATLSDATAHAKTCVPIALGG